MRLLLIGGVGIVLGVGIVIGMPIGIAAYFKFLADMNEAGRDEATYQNLKRQAEEEAKWNKPTTY